MPGRRAGVDHARDRVVPRVLLGGGARLVRVVGVRVLDHAVAGVAAADARRLHAPRGGEVGGAEAHALHARAGGRDLLEVHDALRGLEDRVDQQRLAAGRPSPRAGRAGGPRSGCPTAPSTFGTMITSSLSPISVTSVREVVEHPGAVEAVDPGPELGVAEVDLLADPDQALAGGDPCGRPGPRPRGCRAGCRPAWPCPAPSPPSSRSRRRRNGSSARA